jgi:uncharacterized protein YuzE
MRVAYDASADSAYIYIEETIRSGGVAKTYPCDPQEVGGMINLDFDSGGRLIGIEVLDASKFLPDSLLQARLREDPF